MVESTKSAIADKLWLEICEFDETADRKYHDEAIKHANLRCIVNKIQDFQDVFTIYIQNFSAELTEELVKLSSDLQAIHEVMTSVVRDKLIKKWARRPYNDYFEVEPLQWRLVDSDDLVIVEHINVEAPKPETGTHQEEHDRREDEQNLLDIAGFPPRDNADDFESVEKKISIIQQAGEQILNNHRFATIEESKRIYCYKGGVYVPGGELTIAKEAERLFHYQMSNHKVTEVEGHIKRRTFHERKEFDADPEIINVKNTLYDVTTAETRPHDPNYLSLNQSPIIYEPKAKPKLFGKFLKEVLYPEQIRALVELMAYTFYRENPFEAITILHGSGLNGKSVLLGVLTALHGIENVSNTSLKTIGERPFALFDLVDKCVNIDEELSNGMIDDTAILKKITGRRPTRVEQKNLASFEAVIYAKLWFSANEIPQTPEETDAFHRRINVVTFPNKFEDGKADPDKIKTLTTPEELSGIFNVLMIALRRVLKDKSIFSREKTIADQTRRYDMTVNPVNSFIDMAFTEEHNGTDYVSKERVYQAYKIFCKEFKLAVISYGSFGKKMKKEGWPDKKITFADDKRHHCWTGLRLTNEYLEKIRLAGPSIIQETLDELR